MELVIFWAITNLLKFILEKHIVTIHGSRVDRTREAVLLRNVEKIKFFKNKTVFGDWWTCLHETNRDGRGLMCLYFGCEVFFLFTFVAMYGSRSGQVPCLWVLWFSGVGNLLCYSSMCSFRGVLYFGFSCTFCWMSLRSGVTSVLFISSGAFILDLWKLYTQEMSLQNIWWRFGFQVLFIHPLESIGFLEVKVHSLFWLW